MSNNNILPIKPLTYTDENGREKSFIPIGHEKAIYGEDNVTLDTKIQTMQDNITDAFSTEKDYVVGDYCIYLNGLYKFTEEKEAGAWDGTKVVPISLTNELKKNFLDGSTDLYNSQDGYTVIVQNGIVTLNFNAVEIPVINNGFTLFSQLSPQYYPIVSINNTLLVMKGENSYDGLLFVSSDGNINVWCVTSLADVRVWGTISFPMQKDSIA